MVQAMRQAMINSANQQLAAARNVLAVAESKGANAQSRLGSATIKLQQAADEFRTAHSAVHSLTVQQNEIETEILDQQADDSPLALAEDKVDQAKDHLDEIATRLLDSPAIKEKLAGLKGSEFYARRAEVLSLEPEYSLARSQLQLVADDLERIRRELFQSDSGWKSTAESLVEARKDEAKADSSSASSGMSRLAPLGDLRKASNAAAAARQAIAQSEAVLKSLKSTPKKPATSYSSSTNKKPNKK